MIAPVLIFILTYILMLLCQRLRPFIALAGGAAFLLGGILPPEKLSEYIDLNVLLMIAGTMGTVSMVIESGMPALLSDIILERVPNVKWATVVLSLFAGIVSAFVDNVATVLMIAPIAMAMAGRLELDPVPMVIAIAVSSNLQGAATLVGDTTSIMLGGYAGMGFVDFFVCVGKPGIFFAVELGAAASAGILLLLFRRQTAPAASGRRTQVKDYLPSGLLLATVALLIAASLLPERPPMTNGLICMGLMLAGAVCMGLRRRSFAAFLAPFRETDFRTLALLFGLFILVGGITEAGVVDAAARLFTRLGGGNMFLIYTAVVWGSVIISAFIDNIPYVATMLPVVQSVAVTLGAEPELLYFGLLSGATLGGNLTPVGASANITGIGILRRDGREVSNRDFMRIGVPFTLAAVIPAYVFIWIFYGG